MLRPAKMKKIRIYATSSIVPAVIKKLHELGVVEIRKFKAEGLQDGKPLEIFDDVSARLLKIRSLASSLDIKVPPKKYEKSIQSLFEESDYMIKTVGEKTYNLIARKTEIEEALKRLNANLQIISKLQPFDIDFNNLSTNTLSFVVGEINEARVEELKNQLSKATDIFDLIQIGQKGKSSLVLIVYKKGTPIEPILASFNFSTIEVPKDIGVPSNALSKVKQEIQTYNNELKLIEKELNDIAAQYGEKISTLYKALSIEADRAEIASRFATSKMVAIISGWVKETNYANLKKEMEQFNDYVFVEDVPIDHEENVPVVLENPPYASPFEFVTREYSLPNYFEFDPTMFYLITLPILYAMIVGDVFYGIASIFISRWIFEKFKTSETMRNVCTLWFYSAFPTIIFGIIFNEWGGMTIAQWFSYLATWGLPDLSAYVAYNGLSRLHGFSLFLGITLLAGFLHLAIGFIMGAIKNWNHHRKHAYAKLAWLGVELSGTAAICSSFLGILPSSFALPSLIIFVLSAVALFLTEGIIGIFELPGLAGNILSYARIAAVGVVGVVLAEIINEFFLPSAANGILALVLLPLLFGLHAINAFIAMFEALIQGGRLNVIEFKSKFVDGGGVLFSPFSLYSKNKK